MDPIPKNKADKSALKPGSSQGRNDHDAPGSVGETDEHSDEEQINEMERNNSLNEDTDNKNNKQGKIINNENSILENPERVGESEDGSI